MNTEANIIQQQLFEPFGGAKQQLDMRRTAAKEGHLPTGQGLTAITQEGSSLEPLLNEGIAPRVVIASPNTNFSLIPEQVAIAGGWCALRTADVKMMNEGTLMDPSTGTAEKVTSVQQVADWIECAVAFDQIVESIGALSGKEYIAVSEQKLWADRVITKTAKILGKKSLTQKEEQLIRDSVEHAEKRRAVMTERYLQMVTGNKSLQLTRAVDEDFLEDLKLARDDLLQQAGLSLEELKQRFPNQATMLDSQTLVWAMYSEPYFDALRRRGYISSPTALIAEPTFHTYADDQAGTFVVRRIYQNRGVYFKQNGINPNTGFVAFMECIQENGSSTRKKLTVDMVPNVSNWQNLFSGSIFDPEMCLDISLTSNTLFLWSVNLIPFGKTRETLLALIEVKRQYRETVKIAKPKSRDQADAIKVQFLEQVDILNQALAKELWIFFERMSEGYE